MRNTHFLKRTEGNTGENTNETDRPKPTDHLEIAEGGICQDTERNRPTKAHSLPGDGRGTDLLGHGRIRPSKADSLSEDGIGRYLSGHGKKPTDRGPLTV